jgi:hypothetical protein
MRASPQLVLLAALLALGIGVAGVILAVIELQRVLG